MKKSYLSHLAPLIFLGGALIFGGLSGLNAQEASGGKDLNLFAPGTAWKFEKNTGEGSFELAAEGGQQAGVLSFDFSSSTTAKVPYVIAVVPLEGADKARAITLQAQSGIPQKITFRVIDSTDQVHQFKTSLAGSGSWESLTIPLDKKLEHWDGANDGVIHFPLKSFTISVPRPNEQTLTGKVKFSDAKIVE